MNYEEILSLINTNIGDDAFITPEKDREVRLAILNYLPMNRGSFDTGDLPGTIINYNVSGNILSATRIGTTPQGSIVRCVMHNPMKNTNYKISTSIQSIGDIQFDNDIRPIVFKPETNEHFLIYLENEGDVNTHNTIQNLRIHLDVIQL